MSVNIIVDMYENKDEIYYRANYSKLINQLEILIDFKWVCEFRKKRESLINMRLSNGMVLTWCDKTNNDNN